MAEAVCSFHSGGGQLLHCKQSGGLVVFRDEETLEADLQLKNNVMELNDVLFWVTECEVQEVTRNGVTQHEATLEGFALSGQQLETVLLGLVEQKGRLKVRLFAGDYLVRYRCAQELELQYPAALTLEKMVLNPTRRDPGTYAECKPFQCDLMNINDDQARAVRGLKSRVEIIHGPPGTGKSTTIFHVLCARLPAGAAAVVTCVTNQAIDAVAEKLSKAHEKGHLLRILVLGNPNRVGVTAGKYTLDALCERDALVVSMQWAHNLLRKTLRAAEALQLARQNRLWKPHQRSRLTLPLIEQLPSVQRYKAQLEVENLQRRRTDMPLETYDPLTFYLDRLNSTKQKMAEVVTRTTPLKIPRARYASIIIAATMYLGGRRPQRTWNVEGFCERLRKCFAKAQVALRVAKYTAPARTVRNTRVFLCTIPSSYKAGNGMAMVWPCKLCSHVISRTSMDVGCRVALAGENAPEGLWSWLPKASVDEHFGWGCCHSGNLCTTGDPPLGL